MRVLFASCLIFCISCEKIFDSSSNEMQTICPPAHVSAYRYAQDSLFVHVHISTYTNGELFTGDMNGNLRYRMAELREGQSCDLSLKPGTILWYRYSRCEDERFKELQKIDY